MGRGFRAAMVALAVMVAAPVVAQESGDPPAAQALPDQVETARLIWTTLVALDQANRTGNYTVFRDIAAPSFQAANDAARLADIFRPLRDGRLDLSRAVLAAPEFIEPPRAIENGQFFVIGRFPSRPAGIVFEMLFEPVNGEWRLFGISVRADTMGGATPPQP
jgi:hypothetical protein